MWDGTIPQTKQRKTKPQPEYWRLLNLLKQLRLKYGERNRGEKTFHIVVKDFGIVFRFNKLQKMTDYENWDAIDVDLEEYKKNPIEFGQNLMWLLISKGYMAYLRNKESGDTRLFRHFIIDEGWGTKIIDNRLSLYKDEPRHNFMIQRNKRLRQVSMHYILTHHPDFFDYLW